MKRSDMSLEERKQMRKRLLAAQVRFANAASELLGAMYHLHPDDEDALCAGVPFDRDFQEMPNALLMWRESVEAAFPEIKE